MRIPNPQPPYGQWLIEARRIMVAMARQAQLLSPEHAPTIGGGFEQAYRQFLESLFNNSKLAIGSGFVQYEDGTQSFQIDSLIADQESQVVLQVRSEPPSYHPRPSALLVLTELKMSFRYEEFDAAIDKIAAVKARCPRVVSLYVAMRKSEEVNLQTLRRHWQRVPRERRIDLVAILNLGAWSASRGRLEPVTGLENSLWAVYYFIARHLHDKMNIVPYISARIKRGVENEVP